MVHEAASVSGTRKHYATIDDQNGPGEYSKKIAANKRNASYGSVHLN
jgi:hypothetical protein